jgi:hypothetical protein
VQSRIASAMPKPLPANARPHCFKKGQSGNPRGRIPNTAIVALKNITIDTYREVIEIVLRQDISALKELTERTSGVSALQVGVARAFYKAMKTGDYEIIERIAERIVGKIPDQINLVSKNLNANVELPQESKVTKEEIDAAMNELSNEV